METHDIHIFLIINSLPAKISPIILRSNLKQNGQDGFR